MTGGCAAWLRDAADQFAKDRRAPVLMGTSVAERHAVSIAIELLPIESITALPVNRARATCALCENRICRRGRCGDFLLGHRQRDAAAAGAVRSIGWPGKRMY